MEKERVRAWPVWDFKERIVNSQIYIFYCDSPVIMNKFKRRRSAFLYFYWRINFVIRLFSNKIVKYLVSHDAEGRRKKFIDKKSLEGNKKLISITEEPTGHEKRIARLSSHGASLFLKKTLEGTWRIVFQCWRPNIIQFLCHVLLSFFFFFSSFLSFTWSTS